MDLKKLDSVAACEQGLDVPIKHPDGTPTDITFKVIGVDSKVFRQGHATLQAKLKLAEKRGKEIPHDDIEGEYCRLMARCTLGWENLTDGGKDVPFSQDKAAEIYENYPIIKSQVFVALLDREAFLGNSQGAS
jgi:hypothetical protein